MSFPKISNDEPFEYEGMTFRALCFADLEGDEESKQLEVYVGKYEIDYGSTGVLSSDQFEALMDALHGSDEPFDLQRWVSLIITSFIEHPNRDEHIITPQHWGWTGE